MTDLNYWIECLSIAAEECDINLSDEQLAELAESVSYGHQNYGMAFYSPSSSDRYSQIEREWKNKYEKLEREFDAYRGNAETAVKKALKQYSDTQVTIGEYGKVYRHDGRTEQIQ